MRLGLGSYACAWAAGVPEPTNPSRDREGAESAFDVNTPLDAIGLIRRAQSLGLYLVQIADNISLEHASDRELHRICHAAGAAGIEIELGTRGIQIAHLERFIALCVRLDSRLLRVVVDTKHHQPSPKETVDAITAMLPKLTSAGVVLAIENHDRFPARTLSNIVERISNPAVGICLDTVNSFGALEGPEYVIETLGPHVVNLHLKDFTIVREPHMMGFRILGAPAGNGRLDIPWLLARLRYFKRDVNAILELWPEPERDAAATIAKEERWCIESVRYLRTLIPD